MSDNSCYRREKGNKLLFNSDTHWQNDSTSGNVGYKSIHAPRSPKFKGQLNEVGGPWKKKNWGRSLDRQTITKYLKIRDIDDSERHLLLCEWGRRKRNIKNGVILLFGQRKRDDLYSPFSVSAMLLPVGTFYRLRFTRCKRETIVDRSSQVR